MTRKELALRYGRIGLILAAFGVVAAIVFQPLWQELWSPGNTVVGSRVP